jgi:predicted amidohydrolase YtcJ
MNIVTRIFFLPIMATAFAGMAGCTVGDESEKGDDADLVLQNGSVYTVDADRSWAEAVAVDDGRIVFVGSTAAAGKFVGRNTKVVDLGGRMLLPGFQDSHVHPITGGIELASCDLNGASGLQAYRSIIGEYAATNPEVPWITGGGWLMSEFGPGGIADKHILDELVPDRPVFLDSADGHTAWVNSKALEIAGIDNDTPDPVDGRIDRDPETGAAIGSLQEGAMKLVSKHLPPPTRADRVRGLQLVVDMLHAFGITAIQDARLDAGSLAAYQELESQHNLKLRVAMSQRWNRERGIEQVSEFIDARERSRESSLLRLTSVKIHLDGVLENYAAALLEPYLLPGDNRGITMVKPATLNRAVTLLDAAGFQLHFHAIGDAAVRQALDAVEEAIYENGRKDNRHHIAHLELIDPADIPRFAELGVVANFQPAWAYADAYVTELTVPFIGEERARWLYPIRSVEDAGGVVAFGSDWSVSTANPLEQIETAVTRKHIDDDSIPVFIAEERISLDSAIAAFTINAAFVNHHEKETGSIEVGKYADLIVIDRNLFELEPAEISAASVLLTLFEGRPVFGDPDDL